MSSRVLIAGCGYVGNALAVKLLTDGHRVWGLRRNPEALAPGVKPVQADLAASGSLGALPEGLDRVVYAASAGGPSDHRYRKSYDQGPRNLQQALADGGHGIRRFVFVSSTGVYGQSGGEWIDETSPAEPSRERARWILRGEEAVMAGPFPGVVVRFGGIYGPGRTRLVEAVRSGEARVPAEPVYTNRIHRDDCAGVLRHLLFLDEPRALYLGVDREPAELGGVMRWLASVQGLPEPRVAAPGEAGRTRGGKRCSSRRLVDSGYAFTYPTFREGYAQVLNTLPRSRT